MQQYKINDKVHACPVELTLDVIGGKWKVLIIWRLMDGTRRYGELRKGLPGITHKMLAAQLRELEEDGIVYRQVYAVVPPKVEYSLTGRGNGLRPVLEQLRHWGELFGEERC